jgi:hypothetical protein
MVPFLAPLLGSMAASLLPATVGTGIAGALGLSGAGAGLIAAAAPKALGAGLGTLLAGGDLGDAALNAVGFGAGSTALGAMMGNAPGAAASAAGTTGAGAAAAAPATQPMDAIKAIAQGLGALGGDQPQAATMPASAGVMRPEQTMRNDIMAPNSQNQIGASAVNQMASTTVPSGGSSMMPASVGLGSLPGPNGLAMADQNLMMGLPNGASDFLRGQNRGFA